MTKRKIGENSESDALRAIDRDDEAKARNGQLSDEEITRLAKKGTRVRTLLVIHQRRLPFNVLLALSRDEAAKIRALVAEKGSRLSLSDRIRLSDDEDPRVRAIAVHLVADEREVLEKLARDRDPIVRRNVARCIRFKNSKLKAVEKTLSEDPEPDVRAVLATRERIDLRILAKMANDPDASVRLAVADHRATPLRSLSTLAKDDDVEVAAIVSRRNDVRPSLAMILADSPHAVVRRQAAFILRISSRKINELARDHDNLVRRLLCGRRRLPTKAVEALANDSSASVRTAMAEFIEAKFEKIIMAMALDKEPDVRAALAANNETTAIALAILSKDRLSGIAELASERLAGLSAHERMAAEEGAGEALDRKRRERKKRNRK
jgi:hypothetical protein